MYNTCNFTTLVAPKKPDYSLCVSYSDGQPVLQVSTHVCTPLITMLNSSEPYVIQKSFLFYAMKNTLTEQSDISDTEVIEQT